MFWYTFIYLLLFLFAVTDNYRPSSERSKYEVSLANMNSACKKKTICGVLTIIAALPVIIDVFLKPTTPDGQYFPKSQIFKVDYDSGGALFCLTVSLIVIISWLVWLFYNANYRKKNVEKLEDIIRAAEEKQAEIAERISNEEKENERFVSGLSAQYGAPGKIVKICDNMYENAFIVFPVSQTIYANSRMIPFSQLLGCEIKDDTFTTVTGTTEEITRTSNGSAVGRALVGGLLAGPAGAIIGGATATRETEVIDNTQTITHHHYFVIINLADVAAPTIKIDCGTESAQIAEEISGSIKSIIAQKSPRQTAPVSIADELTKLANLKLQGFLTDEEFAQQKRILLSSATQPIEMAPVEMAPAETLVIESNGQEAFEDPLKAELAQLLRDGFTLEAIKRYKDATGCDLASAKSYIDNLKEEIGL